MEFNSIIANMITRTLENHLSGLRLSYPALMVTGPRQSGKTTLAKRLFSDLPYVNLESPLEQSLFHQDPVGFLQQYSDGAIFDEAQNLPELFSYLQVIMDEDGRMGRWILTGSQQMDLPRSASQSLAGRVALLELLPFSHDELKQANVAPQTLAEAVLKGGYPPLFDMSRKPEPGMWLENYLATFVNRDVRNILEVRDRQRFDLFIRKCASLSGCLVNKAEIASTAGIDNKTVDHWLSILEACNLIRLLRPYHRNFGKRLNKRPKLYFLDTGLACRLLYIANVQQLRASPQWGSLVESWCYGEILKYRRHRVLPHDLWFWRSSDGIEVDILWEQNASLVPFEIKAAVTPKVGDLSGIDKFKRLQYREKGVEIQKGVIVYGGDQLRTIQKGHFVPWSDISSHLDMLI